MTSVGMSVKVTPPAAAVDAAATAVPQPGGEADAFSQLMAVIGMPVETPAAAQPADALVAGLAAIQTPAEGEIAPTEVVADKPTPDEAQQASCMIEIADLAAKMLQGLKVRARGEDPESDAPKGDEAEGEAPTAEQDGEKRPIVVAAPTLPIILVDPQNAKPPVQPTIEPKEAAPAVQVAAANAALPKTVTSQQPAADDTETNEQVEPSAQSEEKPVFVLPQPLRAAIQTLIGDKAPAFARPEAQPVSAPTPANDQPAVALLPAAPLTTSSVIALMQSQLAAVAAPSQPAAVAIDPATAPASPELVIERQLDMAKDNEWLDSLARDIASTTGRDSTLRFRLHPQSLGTLQVEVAQSHAGTSVRLTADTEAARSIIADAQPRLLAEARAQGVRIAEAHVGMELGSHHASDQRRHSENRQETFLRTAAGEADTHNEETTRAADGSAERFA